MNEAYPCVWENGEMQFVHRKRAEKAVGHKLPKHVVIHHVGGDKSSDVIVICPNQKYHMLLHIREASLRATGSPHNRKCKFCGKWDNPSNMYANPDGFTFLHRLCSNVYVRTRRRDNDGAPNCACGCGQKVNRKVGLSVKDGQWNKYIHGHNAYKRG